jgi:hypothetical protein
MASGQPVLEQRRWAMGQTNHDRELPPQAPFCPPEDRAFSLHWRRPRSFYRMFVGVNTPNPAFSVDSHGQKKVFLPCFAANTNWSMAMLVGLFPCSTSLCTAAYEGFPGLASLAKTAESAPRASIILPMPLPKTGSEPHFKPFPQTSVLHGTAKFPTCYPSWLI